MKKRQTSEIGTTSLQGTKAISPKRPLLGGSTVLTKSGSYGQTALFPVKAVYYTGYICVVESHAFN